MIAFLSGMKFCTSYIVSHFHGFVKRGDGIFKNSLVKTEFCEGIMKLQAIFSFAVDKTEKLCYNVERGTVIFRKNDLLCESRKTMLTFWYYAVNNFGV